MINFFKYIIIQLMNRYGSFMWFGVHVGVTQVDWHWVMEIFICVLINIMVLHTIYLEWKDSQIKN